MFKPLTSTSQLKSLAIGLLATGCLITGPAFAGGAVSPILEVQKTCTLDTTAPGGNDGQVNPGDTLICKITINTEVATATGVTVNDVLDPNTTFVEGSVNVTDSIDND